MRVRRTITSTVTIAAAAVTGIAVLSGPATADASAKQTYTAEDAQHDVVRVAEGQENGPGIPVPHRTADDLVSMQASYADDAVSVTLQYASLVAPAGNREVALTVVSLRTDQGQQAGASLVTRATRPKRQLEWDSSDNTRCRALAATVSYADAQVRFTVPGSCLHDPEWVRVGGGAATVDGQKVYADDVQKPGAIAKNLVLGPRLRQAQG